MEWQARFLDITFLVGYGDIERCRLLMLPYYYMAKLGDRIMSAVYLLYTGHEDFEHNTLIDVFESIESVNKFVADLWPWEKKKFSEDCFKLESMTKTVRPRLQYFLIKKMNPK